MLVARASRGVNAIRSLARTERREVPREGQAAESHRAARLAQMAPGPLCPAVGLWVGLVVLPLALVHSSVDGGYSLLHHRLSSKTITV